MELENIILSEITQIQKDLHVLIDKWILAKKVFITQDTAHRTHKVQ